MRNYGNIAKGYGYNVSVIDLRNPTRSNGNNLLHLVNKYMDLYQQENKLIYKAKAEKYAKIISKTIILSGMDTASFGQNAYFYDAAEGLLTATILLVAEFCEPQKRHIVCWPAIPTIAAELKLSQSTVRRALRDLRKAGLLETEQRYRTKGGKSSLLYKIRGG